MNELVVGWGGGGGGRAGGNTARGWGGLKCGQALQIHRPPTVLGTKPIPSLLGREQGSIPSQEETTLCAHLSFWTPKSFSGSSKTSDHLLQDGLRTLDLCSDQTSSFHLLIIHPPTHLFIHPSPPPPPATTAAAAHTGTQTFPHDPPPPPTHIHLPKKLHSFQESCNHVSL